MGDKVNKSPLSAREGKVYLDGALVAEACKFGVKFIPKLWEGKVLCERGTNRRWTGYDIKVNVEQWKTTTLFKKKILEYIKSGKTPEFTLQGISDDKNSDYYENNGGAETITAIGCVPTGEVSLIELDTEGDVMKESIEFGAYDVV